MREAKNAGYVREAILHRLRTRRTSEGGLQNSQFHSSWCSMLPSFDVKMDILAAGRDQSRRGSITGARASVPDECGFGRRVT